MALQNSQPEDIRAILAVSQEEARLGGWRVLNLAGGRTIRVTVPAGIRDGEELRLVGQGLASAAGRTAGDLVLRITVITVEHPRDEADDALTAESEQPAPPPQPPIVQTHADYAPGGIRYTAPTYTQPDAYAPVPNEAAGNGYTPWPSVYQHASQPNLGSYPNYSTPGQAGQVYVPQYYPPQQPPQPQRRRGGAFTALILALVLLLLVGSGLFFYFGYYRGRAPGTVTTQTQTVGTNQVSQTGTTRLQATAQAYQNLYTQATSGTPALNDPLTAQTDSQWDNSSGADGSCSFSDGGYHSAVPKVGFFQPCYAQNTNFSNFAFQIDMTVSQGDEGGILFRADSLNDKFYLFRIDGAGAYVLYLYASSQGSQARQLMSGSTTLINPVGQSNEITLLVQGNSLTFYINQDYLNSITDNTYSSGKIGVFGESATQATDVVFRNAKVWTL